MNIDKLASKALKLSHKDRAVLAEALWNSLEDPYLKERKPSDEASIDLALQRDREIENGAARPISHEALMGKPRNQEG